MQTSSRHHPPLILINCSSAWAQAKPELLVTIDMLVNALKIMLDALHLDTSLYLLHRRQRDGTISTYQVGIHQIDIKHHRRLFSDAFWIDVTSPCLADSPMAAALASAMDDTQ